MKLIYSCVISFVWVSLINAVNTIWLHKTVLYNIWVISILSCLLSVIFAIAFAKIYTAIWFHKLLVELFGVSPHDSVWNNVVNLNNGTNLKVYLRGKSYYIIGHIYSYEENGNDSWFCLKSPVIYNIENNQEIYSQDGNEKAFLTFNIKDVEMTEIFT